MISTKRVLFTILICGLQNGSPPPSALTGTQYIYSCTRIVICIVSRISPAIVMRRVTAQCENTGCVPAEHDSTRDCVKVIFI